MFFLGLPPFLYIYIYIYIYTYIYDNITETYKKVQSSLPKKINMEAKKITKSFNVNNKMDITTKRQCFVIIIDHKDDFRKNPKYRLLNPTKK